MMKIMITGCDDKEKWYADKIGMIYNVSDKHYSTYEVRVGKLHGYVDESDCGVVDDEDITVKKIQLSQNTIFLHCENLNTDASISFVINTDTMESCEPVKAKGGEVERNTRR